MNLIESENITCNELKCRSLGFNDGYDCWALGPDFGDPFACEEGYEGIVLSSVEQFISEGVGTFQYYTCCTGVLPSGDVLQSNFSYYAFDSDVLPECSVSLNPCGDIFGDCIADGPYEAMVCNDDVYKYPNKNGFTESLYSWQYSQYQCCRSQINTDQTNNNFLPEVFRVAFGCIGLFLSCSMILGILSCRATRAQSFNLFILYSNLVEVFANLILVIVGSITLAGKSLPGCQLLTYTGYCYPTVNQWLNAIIIHELYKILVHSRNRRKSRPPSRRKVFLYSVSVYMLGLVEGIFALYLYCENFLDLPLEERIYPNVDKTYERLSILLGLVMALIPLSSVSLRIFQIWKKGLIPRAGHTRVLTIYLLRIVISYIFVWVPAIITTTFKLRGTFEGSYYIYFTPINTIITFCFSIVKPDIKCAVFNLWLCRTKEADILMGSIASFSRFQKTRPMEGGSSTPPKDDSISINSVAANAQSSGNEDASLEVHIPEDQNDDHWKLDEKDNHMKLLFAPSPNSIWYEEDDWGEA